MGEETRKATVTIRDQRIEINDGHIGEANLQIIADSRTWLRFIAKE